MESMGPLRSHLRVEVPQVPLLPPEKLRGLEGPFYLVETLWVYSVNLRIVYQPYAPFVREALFSFSDISISIVLAPRQNAKGGVKSACESVVKHCFNGLT